MCRGVRKIVREFYRPVRKRALVPRDNQNPRGQAGKRSCVQDGGRDQCQGRDPLRVEGRQAMPIFKRRGTAGGDVSSLDAEMAKQIEQTGLDRAGSCCFHISLRCSTVVLNKRLCRATPSGAMPPAPPL